MAQVQFPTSIGGDGSVVTDDANPDTGLAQGGHRERFVPALAQLVAVASYVVNAVTQTLASSRQSEDAAGGYAEAASGSYQQAKAERLLAEQVTAEGAAHRDAAAASAVIAASYTEQAAIRSTANTIDADSVIGGGFNGLSVGPIAVAEGITVTVEPNHTWSIV